MTESVVRAERLPLIEMGGVVAVRERGGIRKGQPTIIRKDRTGPSALTDTGLLHQELYSYFSPADSLSAAATASRIARCCACGLSPPSITVKSSSGVRRSYSPETRRWKMLKERAGSDDSFMSRPAS